MSLVRGNLPTHVNDAVTGTGHSSVTRVKGGDQGLRTGVEVWGPKRGHQVHVHGVSGSGSRRKPGERRTDVTRG